MVSMNYNWSQSIKLLVRCSLPGRARFVAGQRRRPPYAYRRLEDQIWYKKRRDSDYHFHAYEGGLFIFIGFLLCGISVFSLIFYHKSN